MSFSDSEETKSNNSQENELYYISKIYNHENKNVSLSLNKKIKWNEELIEKFYDCWDWNELSLNVALGWDERLIKKYEDKINFYLLSLNYGVKWTLSLIDKYLDNWNWYYLSGNKNIPWSTEFIIHHEDKLVFGNLENDYSLKFTLSSNEGILWDLNLFDRYIEKLNVWDISRHGNINQDVLIKYHQKFNQKKYCGSIYYKYSDWRDSFEIYGNCWQNLIRNHNIDTSLYKDPFFQNYFFEFKYPIGNLARHDGDIIVLNVSIEELFLNGEKYNVKK